MENPRFQKEESLSAFTFVGSYCDLTLIDFSFINLKFINLDNKAALKSYFEKASPDEWAERNYEGVSKIRREVGSDVPIYLLIPIQPKSIPIEVFLNCLDVLLIMFPSNIQFHNEVWFQVFDEKCLSYCGHTTFALQDYGIKEGEGYSMFFVDNWIKDINGFIRLYFERFSFISYLKPIVFNYRSGFRESFLHLEYLSLCICLESVVRGSQELSYRIRRHLAVLCGDNYTHSGIIFQNVKKIYDLRSKIIHGDDYDYEQLGEYIIYLRALISRMVIELVIHNIDTQTKLDWKLTVTGFGANSELSENYIPLNPNVREYSRIVYRELSKAK